MDIGDHSTQGRISLNAALNISIDIVSNDNASIDIVSIDTVSYNTEKAQ